MMPSIQVCRPKPHRHRWPRLLRLPGKLISPFALLGGWIMIAGLTALLPSVYTGHKMAVEARQWEGQSHELGRTVVKEWTRVIPVLPFYRGDEAEVEKMLAEEPLLHALADPDKGIVWIRDGLHFRAPRAAEGGRLLEWAGAARASGQATWIPPSEDHPEFRNETVLALASGRWWQFKVWKPGAPEPEMFLGRLIDADSPYRFALTRYDRDPEMGRKNADPIPKSRLAATLEDPNPYFSNVFPDLSLPFGEPWVVGVWGTRVQRAIMEHRLRTWKVMAWGAHFLFVAVLGLGCLLQFYISRRERLRADQLGFLAHSLKTPLTILKLRCDTIRNTQLSKDVQDTQVAKIGDEVDKLVKVIEAGLEGVRPESVASSLDLIDSSFFARLRDQMEPIFAGEARTLEVDVVGVSFRAPARALGPALNTLLENALTHGKGTVSIHARQGRSGCEIQVRDEGSGIPLEKISGLIAAGAAQEPGVPGLGHGVGIFLLTQMAVHEGWGLRFDSVERGGFMPVLEIPV